MRIIHVTSVSGAGGVQRCVIESCRALAARDHDVAIVAMTASTSSVLGGDELVVEQVESSRRALGRYRVPIGGMARLRQIVTDGDVIHAHQPLAGSTLITASLSGPKVLSCYAHPVARATLARWRRLAVTKAVARRFQVVVAISDAERALLVSQFGMHPEYIEVVRPGHHRLLSPDRPGRANPPSPRLVLTVGGLVPHKRVELFLRSAAEVPDVQPVVVGRGPELERLSGLAGQLGFDPPATLLGELSESDLVQLYRKADCYVALSTDESFGLALLDAVAAGVPVVASDIPSHREILERAALDDCHLLPVDAGESRVAASIAAQLSGPSRPLVGALPSWDRCAAELERVYEGVLTSPRRGGAPSEKR